MTDVKLAIDCACGCGENPLWHETEQRLYFVDNAAGKLLRFDPRSGEIEQLYQAGGWLGGFTFQEDGSLLLVMDSGVIAVRRGDEVSFLVEGVAELSETMFNDLIADPEGRVFSGTMRRTLQPTGLYRLDCDGSLTCLLDDAILSNGLGFTPDRRGLYFTDTLRRNIYRFDYDRATGAITSRQTLVTVPEGEGFPDGMTVDAEGYIWSARWAGGRIARYAPDGMLEREITIPTGKVTSLTFAGPDYTDIYVTTAGGNTRDLDGDLAGAIFHLNLGIRGLPEFKSRIGL